MLCKALILVSLLNLTIAKDLVKSDKSDFKKSLSGDCEKIYSSTCLKWNILSWVEKLNEENDFAVLPGVSVVKETSLNAITPDLMADISRSFPNDSDKKLDAVLIKKVTEYLNSHSIRLNLWDPNEMSSARGGGGGGGGLGGGGGGGGNKGGGGGMGMILAAGAMMKGTLMALALGGLAAIAGKALMTALISLLLSAIIGLKSLTHGHKQTTYEVISKPIYTHSNTHSVSHEEHPGHLGHSSYGRSFDIPLPLGLRDDYNLPK